MELVVSVEEGIGADLYRWLTADWEIPDGAAITPADSGERGSMGIGFDLLNLIIPNAISMGSLVTSIAAFRQQCREATGHAPHITVEHAGTVVVVDDDHTDS